MFQHFRAGDEVVLLLQGISLRMEEGVVQRHGHARLFEHFSKHRAGAAAEIEPVGPARKSGQQRICYF